MGVRPPAGGSGEKEAVEFGIAAITPTIDDAELDFPLEAEEVVRTLNDPAIPVDARGRTIQLSTAFEEIDRQRFDSERELLNALHPVLETYREDVSTGWLASIRRSLPF